MGCYWSARFVADPKIVGRDEIALEAFDELLLSQGELDLFFTAFLDIDADDSNTILLEELLNYFSIKLSFLNRKLFKFYDSDGNGELDFCEFVVAMWNFLSLDETTLIDFVFCLFTGSTANDNSLDITAIKTLCESLVNKPLDQSEKGKRYYAYLKDALEPPKNVLDCFQFNKLVSKDNTILSPLIDMQKILRTNLIGDDFWVDIIEKRRSNLVQEGPRYVMDLNRRLEIKKEAKRKQRLEASIARSGNKHIARKSTIFQKIRGNAAVSPESDNKTPTANRKKRSTALFKAKIAEKKKTLKKKKTQNGNESDGVVDGFVDIGGDKIVSPSEMLGGKEKQQSVGISSSSKAFKYSPAPPPLEESDMMRQKSQSEVLKQSDDLHAKEEKGDASEEEKHRASIKLQAHQRKVLAKKRVSELRKEKEKNAEKEEKVLTPSQMISTSKAKDKSDKFLRQESSKKSKERKQVAASLPPLKANVRPPAPEN